MKKFVFFVLVAFCAASLFAGGSKAAATTEREIIEIKTFGKSSRIPEYHQDALDWVKDKFAIELDMYSVMDYKPQNLEDKPELIWASGDYPHYFNMYVQRFDNLPAVWDHLIDMKPHLDKLPNVRALFSQEEWDNAIARRTRPDGTMPFIFGHNYRIANSAWCFEKNTFDNLGIDTPKTLDDLYEALQVLRAEYPGEDYMLIAGREQYYNIFIGITYAYRLNTGFRLMPDAINMGNPYFIDPDTGELTFSGTADKLLEALRFSKKLMDENLAPDMTTVYEGAFFEEVVPHNKFFVAFAPTKDAWNHYNRLGSTTDPDINWTELWTPLTADPSKKALVPYTPVDWDNSTFITDKVTSPEMMDRILEFIDYFAKRDETGRFFADVHEFYDWLGGPKLTLNTDPDRGPLTYMVPKEWKLGEPRVGYDSTRSPWYGEHGDGTAPLMHLAAYMRRTPVNSLFYADYDPMMDYAESIKGGAGVFTEVILWDRTPEEDVRLRELETAMADIVDNFVRGYLHGKVSDAAWDDYKRDLQKAGLDEAFALRKKIYERSN